MYSQHQQQKQHVPSPSLHSHSPSVSSPRHTVPNSSYPHVPNVVSLPTFASVPYTAVPIDPSPSFFVIPRHVPYVLVSLRGERFVGWPRSWLRVSSVIFHRGGLPVDSVARHERICYPSLLGRPRVTMRGIRDNWWKRRRWCPIFYGGTIWVSSRWVWVVRRRVPRL